MKSKINVRKINETEIELVIEGKNVVGKEIISAKDLTRSYALPSVGSSVEGVVLALQADGVEAKLPSEPVSAYRRVENMMQLGDLLGLGRVN